MTRGDRAPLASKQRSPRASSNLMKQKRAPSKQKADLLKMEESTRSRGKGGAPSNLQTKKFGPPLNHLKTEESSLLANMDSPSQNSRQAPPTSRSVYPSVGKKRHPFSLGKRNRRAPISSSSSEDGRELPLKKKGWSSADLQKEKSGPPLPSLQTREDGSSTSCD